MLWKATGLKQFFAASINEAAVKKVTFLKIQRKTNVFLFAEEEINTTAVRYCQSSPG